MTKRKKISTFPFRHNSTYISLKSEDKTQSISGLALSFFYKEVKFFPGCFWHKKNYFTKPEADHIEIYLIKLKPTIQH